jgi:hypothetical protein
VPWEDFRSADEMRAEIFSYRDIILQHPLAGLSEDERQELYSQIRSITLEDIKCIILKYDYGKGKEHPVKQYTYFFRLVKDTSYANALDKIMMTLSPGDEMKNNRNAKIIRKKDVYIGKLSDITGINDYTGTKRCIGLLYDSYSYIRKYFTSCNAYAH